MTCDDAQDKSQYGRMVDITYFITCLSYMAMAVCGYIMFGESAQSEITLNLR